MPVQWFRPLSAARAQSAARRAGRSRVRDLARSGSAIDRLAIAIASALFTGFLPRGGWWGAGVGMALAAAIPSAPVSAAALAVVTLAGTWATARVHRASGVDDPSEVTIDEVAGAWLAGLLSGLAGIALLLPLLLFCAFDAAKPFPANLLDRREDAFGVMADDLVAGLYGGIAAWGLAALTLLATS